MSVERLNRLFTSAQDLEQTEKVAEYTALAIAHTQTELAHRSTLAADLALPTTALRAATQQLQQKAQATRAEVQAMTAEIKALDTTKYNLVASVTMLKRLQMLTKIHAQLDTQLRERQYRQISQTLGAATELSDYFCQFRSVPHVAHLSQLVADQRLRIAKQAREDIEANISIEGSDLEWACRVLPDSDREGLISWYLERTLQPYLQVFAPGSEAASIDNVDRRYGMLRNILTKHSQSKAFPREWQVGYRLATAACEATQRDISLARFESGQQSVQALLDALHATTEFEAYLRRKFSSNQFQSPISKAFTPHLSVWVDFHERTLADKLRQYQSHQWNEEPEGSDVFASSADIFSYYRTALDQMSKLTTGQPFASLAHVFARCLARYAGLLQSYIPNGPRAAQPEETALAAKIIKTADYCITTTHQLQATIEATIEAAAGDAGNAFEEAVERFLGIVRLCLDLFVEQVAGALKTPWREMANVNWARLHHAGDQSGYVNQLCSTLSLTTSAVADSLSKPAHRRIVCDRLVDQVTHQFLLVVFTRVKPVSEIAAEQLLLDFYAIKATLLDLNRDEKFRDRTQRTAARIEDILKALLTHQDPPESFVRTYLLLTKDTSLANFRKVLEAKGVRPHTRFLDIFNSMASDSGNSRGDSPGDSPLTYISTSRPPAPVASPPPEPLSKFSENFKRFGGFLRRDTQSASPLMK